MFYFSKMLFKKFAPSIREDGLSYGNGMMRYLSVLTDLFLVMILMRFYHACCIKLLNMFPQGVSHEILKKVQLGLKITNLENQEFQSYRIKHIVITFSQLIVLPFYFILPWYYLGGSIGQVLIGLRIVKDENGMPMDNKLIIKRFFSGIPTVMTLMIGFLWSFFDKKRQSLHDKIVKTVVVTKRSLKEKGIYSPKIDIFDDWIFLHMKKLYRVLKIKYDEWRLMKKS